MSTHRPTIPGNLFTDVRRLHQETLALVVASRERLALSKSNLDLPIHRPVANASAGNRAPFSA